MPSKCIHPLPIPLLSTVFPSAHDNATRMHHRMPSKDIPSLPLLVLSFVLSCAPFLALWRGCLLVLSFVLSFAPSFPPSLYRAAAIFCCVPGAIGVGSEPTCVLAVFVHLGRATIFCADCVGHAGFRRLRGGRFQGTYTKYTYPIYVVSLLG